MRRNFSTAHSTGRFYYSPIQPRAGAAAAADNIYKAIDDFKASSWIAEILGSDLQDGYADLKRAAASRCPRELGTIVKGCEVQFHHAVLNQSLWNLF